MKLQNQFLIVSAVALSSLLSPRSSHAAASVRINEFVASNDSGIADENGDFSDWIELYNSGTESVEMAGWALTDSADNPAKWEFPNLILPPGGYLVVFASGKDRNSPKLHTNFSLSEAGEYLALVEPGGGIASEFAPAYPEQRKDVSYGYDTAGNLIFYTTPTPGSVNGGGVVNFVADTKFSRDRGFYDAPFDLAISTSTPDAVIRYTTNGVPPTASTGIVYSGPIHIAGTTVLRAAAFKAGYQPSNVDTQTYFFLDDVLRQSPNGAAPPGWPANWGGNAVDYGMDPDIVNSLRYKDTIKNDLKSVPSLSVVMKLSDLFDPTTGIYANSRQDGASWERPCSLELIYPNGTKGFQVNAGIRIRGGFSRDPNNPKHSFRLFFREEYGASKLNYPMFGPKAAQSFDKFDLRTAQNYSWSYQGDGNNLMLRDPFSRDTQLAMGHQAERGDFYHLYINGQYWGLYNTAERPEAANAASYFGGEREDYDTIKVNSDGYGIFATDGNMTAWTSLYNQAKAGLASDAAFQKLLGNNPDGTPNPALPVLIDLPNLIDYMLVIIYTGNKDAPISNFIGNESPNNWYGVRNRNIDARMGFRFFAHDSEHSILPWDINIDRTGPFPAGDTSVLKSSPQYIWKQMTANAEFRLKVADHIQRHFFNGGLLTSEANTARLLARKAQIDRAIVGESARWGDAKRSSPFTRDDHWVAAVNDVVNNYFPSRTQKVLTQLRADNLFPALAAPVFNQHGGNVNPGFSLGMTSAVGTSIYYTLDGTDPRIMGGAISSKAVRYSAALILNENAQVRARVLSGTTWSALEQADFTIIRTFKDLMITEVMYNPPAVGSEDGEQYEFLELKNVGSENLDLGGIHFTNGVEFIFPNGTHLSAGAFYLLVSNPTNFASKYPGTRYDGVFTNNLANSGETISLIHAAGGIITSFTYDDKAPWPISADGTGYSIVPVRLDPTLDLNDPANWRASASLGGSPGQDDPPVNIPPVVINEVLTRTDLPALDVIELFNPTAVPANVSGWYLTDDLRTPKKFVIPSGTTIPAGGYLVFSESDFNPSPGIASSFTLSSEGEEVYLFSAENGELTGYTQGFKFGAAEKGVSFGRYTNSVGEVTYPAQIAVTLPGQNSGPRIGPVVIDEIQYQPTQTGDEFVELRNISGTAVKLYDPAHPTNTWKLQGINFTFPPNVEIPANGSVVISAIEPGSFRSHNHLPEQIVIYGPFSGALQDDGEMLELLRPDVSGSATNGSVPYILVDSVRYNSHAPWPTGSAGTGASIERLVSNAFGDDPSNWRSSPGAPSPGLDNHGNRLPLVDAGPDVELVSATFPFSVNLNASASDDGLPTTPGKLTFQWTQASGPGAVMFADASRSNSAVSFPGVGVYLLRVTANDGQYAVSDELAVSISRPLAKETFVPTHSVWKYLDNGSDQKTAWQKPEFQDSGWKSGPAVLGYQDSAVTTLNFGPDSSSKYRTYYFRHTFTVNGARNVTSTAARLRRDDGAVVYINGVEAFRSNMPQGVPTYLTFASGVVGGSDETSYFDFTVDPSLLREGSNVIAVEVHQANAGSSDLGFDLELTGLMNFSNQPPSADAGPDLTIQITDPAVLNGVARDDGLPIPPGVFNATWSIVSGPGSVSFTDANRPVTTAVFSVGGVYVLRLTVTDGELSTSDEVTVAVEGNDPYAVWKSQYFSAAELSDAQVSGDDADPDGDSFTNKQEFIAGTVPNDASSFLHVVEVDSMGADFVIRFEAVGDKSYTILGRANAASGDWNRVLDLSPQGATQNIEVLDTMTAEIKEKYYRIVTPQLAPE